MNNIKNHYFNVKKVLIIVLALNWTVAIIKIAYGLITKCASMTADGFHSLSDGASNIIGLIGIVLSCQPKDEDHPYGHKKYETLFSMGIAALLFFVAFNILKEGISRIFYPVTPQIDYRSFMIMLLTIIVNIIVMKYEYNCGKKLQSDILIADSMHTKADIFTSLSVIVSLIAIKLGFPILDPIATLMIAVFIGWAGYEIIKKSSAILCDAAAIMNVKKIESIVLGVKGVKSCHKIRTRGRPDDIHVDLHVQLDSNLHLNTAHNISFEIEGAIKKNIPEVTDVLVHLEPKKRED